MSNKSITLKSLKAEVDTLGRLHSDLAEQVMELVKAAVSEASSHPQRVEAEPWEPKVGDYVVPTGLSACHTNRTGRLSVLKDIDTAQEVEWAKVSELQEGDACEVTPAQQRELCALMKDTGAFPGSYNGHASGVTWVQWNPAVNGAPLQLWSTRPTWIPVNVFPFPEFLRRAKGTAARIQKEAQEKEEAKVVAPWTPVKFKHGLGVEVEGRIVCDGPDHYDYFFIMTNGALGHQVHKRKRHEFTIIEP